MDDNKRHNGKPNGVNDKFNPKSWHPVLSIVLGSILGSGGSLGVIYATPFGQNITRPNPYTSVQAKVQSDIVAQRMSRLEFHVDNHPDAELRAALGLVIADVAAGKAERSLIIANQNRILDRLDKR